MKKSVKNLNFEDASEKLWKLRADIKQAKIALAMFKKKLELLADREEDYVNTLNSLDNQKEKNEKDIVYYEQQIENLKERNLQLNEESNYIESQYTLLTRVIDQAVLFVDGYYTALENTKAHL